MSATTFVLVHGAWHGSWCFEELIAELAGREHPALAVELTSHGEDGENHGDLRADAEHLGRLLDDVDGPVTLLGHSYGGMVITEGGAHPAVERLVYLSAFLPQVGDSVTSLTGGGRPSWLHFGETTHMVSREFGAGAFYTDLEPGRAAQLAQRLVPQSIASFAQPVSHAAWQDRPTTYIVTTRDRSLPPPLQRHFARSASTVIEMSSDHSPFLSRPSELADRLIRLVS